MNLIEAWRALCATVDGDADELADIRDQLVTVTGQRDRALAALSTVDQTCRALRRELACARQELSRLQHPSTQPASLDVWCDDIAALTGNRPVLWRHNQQWWGHVAGGPPVAADTPIDVLVVLFDRVIGAER